MKPTVPLKYCSIAFAVLWGGWMLWWSGTFTLANAVILFEILRWGGAAYLVWLAWRIASSGAAKEGAAAGKPLGALGAAAFQWINPKGWVMAVSASLMPPQTA